MTTTTTTSTTTTTTTTHFLLFPVPKRNQNAVYWPPTGFDDFGKPTLGSAEQLEVRWVDVQELFIDTQGSERLSQAKIFPKKQLKVGGYLWRGLIGQAPADPFADSDAHEIKKFERIPDFPGRKFNLVATV